jgi:hypothetical protein
MRDTSTIPEGYINKDTFSREVYEHVAVQYTKEEGGLLL